MLNPPPEHLPRNHFNQQDFTFQPVTATQPLPAAAYAAVQSTESTMTGGSTSLHPTARRRPRRPRRRDLRRLAARRMPVLRPPAAAAAGPLQPPLYSRVSWPAAGGEPATVQSANDHCTFRKRARDPARPPRRAAPPPGYPAAGLAGTGQSAAGRAASQGSSSSTKSRLQRRLPPTARPPGRFPRFSAAGPSAAAAAGERVSRSES